MAAVLPVSVFRRSSILIATSNFFKKISSRSQRLGGSVALADLPRRSNRTAKAQRAQ
jgi:hypothetical protein